MAARITRTVKAPRTAKPSKGSNKPTPVATQTVPSVPAVVKPAPTPVTPGDPAAVLLGRKPVSVSQAHPLLPVLATQGPGGLRVTVAGHTVSALLKYMGGAGWAVSQATAVLGALGLGQVSPSTVRCQLYSGRAAATGGTPTHSGHAATPTPEVIAALQSLLPKPPAA